MWPRRVELGGSRYPRRLRCAALGAGALAILLSGLPLSLAALTGLAALVAARRWRPAMPRTVDVTPGALRLSLRLARAGLRDVIRPAFKPGSRFAREYHGKTYIVEVGDDGCFVWNEQSFKSLSHTARTITGYNVSVFKFFEVKT